MWRMRQDRLTGNLIVEKKDGNKWKVVKRESDKKRDERLGKEQREKDEEAALARIPNHDGHAADYPGLAW